MIKEGSINGIPVKRAGVKIIDEEDYTFIRWMLFDAADVPDDDNELLARIFFVRRYQGPGRPFQNAGNVKRVGKRVLATQRCGRDI